MRHVGHVKEIFKYRSLFKCIEFRLEPNTSTLILLTWLGILIWPDGLFLKDNG